MDGSFSFHGDLRSCGGVCCSREEGETTWSLIVEEQSSNILEFFCHLWIRGGTATALKQSSEEDSGALCK